MSSIVNNVFSINGVVDTSKSVMENMQLLAGAAGSWITFDVNAGKWSVVINRAGDSVKSFDDSNIIGSITISGTALDEFYNSVQLTYPHKDLDDEPDVITFSIPEEERFPNEIDNTLNFSYDCVNDPVQAELLAVRELKQSRIDKVIQFTTDFTSLGLKAGDIIDVTNTTYGFTAKKFRILTITEEDSDDRSINLAITAFEYDESIYDTTGLERQERTRTTEIVADCANTEVQLSNGVDGLKNTAIGGLAGTALATSLLNLLLNRLGSVKNGSIPALTKAQVTRSVSTVQSSLNSYTSNPEPFSLTGVFSNSASGTPFTVGWTLPYNLTNVIIFSQSVLAKFDYQYKTGGSIYTRTGLIGYVPCNIEVLYGSTVIQQTTNDWQTQNSIIQIPYAPAGTYTLRISPLPTYDLNQETSEFIMPYNYVVQTQASGGGYTATLWSFNT